MISTSRALLLPWNLKKQPASLEKRLKCPQHALRALGPSRTDFDARVDLDLLIFAATAFGAPKYSLDSIRISPVMVSAAFARRTLQEPNTMLARCSAALSAFFFRGDDSRFSAQKAQVLQ